MCTSLYNIPLKCVFLWTFSLKCLTVTHPPLQDIIHQLMEQGTAYSQKDYVNAFKLMAQSNSPPLSQDRLQEHIDRLDQVFSKDTV